MYIAIGMAACVALAVTGGLVFVGNQSTHAFTIGDVPKQMLEVRSIHVKGWFYDSREMDGEKTERYPIEWFAERPNRYCIVGYGISPGKVTEFFQASDGERSIRVNHERKHAVVGTADALSRLSCRSRLLLQNEPRGFAHGERPAAGYKQVAVEEVNGVRTFVYEQVTRREGAPGFRSVVWLNPRTGLPVKSALYRLEASGEEKVQFLFDQIDVNQPPPAHLFTFRAPDGYQVDKAPARRSVSELYSLGSGATGTHRLSGLFAFNIEDRAVLLCWSYENGASPALTEEALENHLPRMTITAGAGNRACSQRFLRSDQGKGETWRWSLVVPEDRKPITEDVLDLVMKIPQKGQMTVSAHPLRFPRERLAEIIQRAQQVTAPEALSKEGVISLDRIENVLKQMAPVP